MRKLTLPAVLAVSLMLILTTATLAKGGSYCQRPVQAPARTWTTQQLVTSTVGEAWSLSGGDYAKFSDMVGTLVHMSAQKRRLDIPNTREAGQEIGEMVRQRAEADPNQLLYVIVDDAVRDYTAKHAQG